MTLDRFACGATFAWLLFSSACAAPEGLSQDVSKNELTGSCTSQIMTVEPQGNETRFGINDQGPVALAPVIPAERICNRLNEKKDSLISRGGQALADAQQCVASCRAAQEVAKQSPVRGFQGVDAAKLKAMGELADAFNAALGNSTKFAEAAGEDADDDVVDDKNDQDDQEDNDNAGQVACNAPVLQIIVTGDTNKAEQRFGVDGRQVALNPNIPIENICQNRVADACKDRCRAAQAAVVASGVRGQSNALNVDNLKKMGEQADNFNRALGNETDFENQPIFQNFTDLGADDDADDADDGANEIACEAPVLQVIVSGTSAKAEQRFGVDGNQVALNPNIPIENICQNRVAKACEERCRAAQAAVVASGIRGQSNALNIDNVQKMGEQADNFNRALGNVTNFENEPIFKNFSP